MNQEIKNSYQSLVDKYANEAREYMVLCSELLGHASTRRYKSATICDLEYEVLKARFDELTKKSFTPVTPTTNGIQANEAGEA